MAPLQRGSVEVDVEDDGSITISNTVVAFERVNVNADAALWLQQSALPAAIRIARAIEKAPPE